MLEFELHDIKVEIMTELEHHEYTDENRYKHSRFERKTKIRLLFWGFFVWGNLQDLALIKSSLSYFMQGYWKRSGKEASKIDLATAISLPPIDGKFRTVNFAARQKYKKNFLHVSLEKDGLIQHELYLDGQQVLMLDVAIGKALSFLSPKIPQQENDIYGYCKR
jgi:hypothetical protein